MARALALSFIGKSKRRKIGKWGNGEDGSAFEGDDVEEESEAHQGEEEHDVLGIDDALGERVEVGDEAEV